MTFFLIEIGKIARNTLKHNSDYINHISSLPDFCNHIQAHMNIHSLQSIQYTLTVIHIHRAEWLYATSFVRLAEACTNVDCAVRELRA